MSDRHWATGATITVLAAMGGALLLACGNDVTVLSERGTEQGCPPGTAQPCLGPGQCAGSQECNATGTAWSSCSCGSGASGNAGGWGGSGGGTGSCVPEQCNGRDDDCNGLVDDGIDCPSDAVQWSGHTYYFFEGPTLSWEQARAACHAHGWHLVTIEDEAEGDWASHELELRGGGWWWMGLNDLSVEGEWVWEDGTSLGYTNWQPGEPSGGSEHCGHLGAFLPASTWNDCTCTDLLPYVCEGPEE